MSLLLNTFIRAAVLYDNIIMPLTRPGQLAAATIAFDGDSGDTLTLERHYAAAADGQGLRMWFTLKNGGSVPLGYHANPPAGPTHDVVSSKA